MKELTLWDEFSTIQNQLSNVEKLMNYVFSNDELVWSNFGSGFPKFNVVETKDEFFVEAAVSGYGKEDLKVEIEDKKVKISGIKKEKYENAKYHLKELTGKNFSKEVLLPANVDVESISVSYKDGILTIKLPKKALNNKAVKEIEIK